MNLAREEWNTDVLKNNNSFLQSYEWGEFQEQLGRKIFRIGEKDKLGFLIEHKLPFGKNYLYSPRRVFNSLSEVEMLVRTVGQMASREKAKFLRIEPDSFKIITRQDLAKLGFVETDSLQPKESLILDISRSEENILAGMEHDTRYAIRSAEKRGVTVETSKAVGTNKALNEFWKLFEETAKRQKISTYNRSYYEKVLKFSSDFKSEIFLAKLDGEYIAGAVVFFFGETATYIYACSAAGYGRYNAPSLLVWEIIKESKRRGFRKFDFWGISSDKKKWKGLTAFKKSFGGEEVEYGGTWDLPLDKPFYLLYKLIKKFR